MEGDVLLAWAAFVGGWLLFAGPVFQASVELRAQDSIREEIGRVVEGVHQPRRVRSWWWLLPPVALILQRRYTRRFQEAAFAVLSPGQRAEWVRLTEKATGWWLVAAGAFLIALHETGRLLTELDSPSWVFWPVIVVAAMSSISFTVIHQRRAAPLVRTGVVEDE